MNALRNAFRLSKARNKYIGMTRAKEVVSKEDRFAAKLQEAFKNKKEK